MEMDFQKTILRLFFNGVRDSEITKPEAGFKKSLGLDDDTLVISILARYEESKGLDFLVESIKRLKEICSRKFCLLIAGDGVTYEKIKKMIEDYDLGDTIKQLGFRRDTANILGISDLYINSSKCLEALSFAMVEALLNGLPIVATDIGGNPDIVSEKNKCGKLVEFGDVRAMSDAIKEFLENDELRKEYSKNALYAAKNVFNLDKLLDDTFKLYK